MGVIIPLRVGLDNIHEVGIGRASGTALQVNQGKINPTMKKAFLKSLNRQIILVVFIAFMIALSGCITYQIEPAQTPVQTVTLPAIEPTALPATDTPVPTPTPFLPSPSPSATPFTAARFVPVIEYHNPSFDMSDEVKMKPEWFIEQLDWLDANGYATLSSAELDGFIRGENPVPEKSVVLSFDIGAGNSEYKTIVIPELQKRGMKAVLFLLVPAIAEECSPDPNAPVICWQDLQTWMDMGVVSIASHGMYHPDFRKLSRDEFQYELQESKRILEQKTGAAVTLFAYPFDSIPERDLDLLPLTGYSAGFGGNSRSDRLVRFGDFQPMQLPRVYPYSNPGIYPNIYAIGKTFGEMLENYFFMAGG